MKENSINEKRDMSKRIALINVIVISCFFVLITILLLVLERPEFSEIERRQLEKMPDFSWEAYFSGEYARKVSSFYNDTVPQRDNLKTFSARFRGLFGITFNEAEFYFNDPSIQLPVTTTAATEKEPDETNNNIGTSTGDIVTEQTAPSETEPEPEIEVSDNIFVLYLDGHWRAMPRFFGGTGTDYANNVNRYKEELGNGVNVYSMLIPTQDEFYLPEKYRHYIASHYDTINGINKMLSNVIPVNAYSVLSDHKKEEIYTRTDHHWQSLGAYYAAGEFAKTANVPFSDLSTYAKEEIDAYLGTFYGMTESPKLLSDPEVFTYYKPSNDYTAYYYTTDYVFEYEFPLFVGQPVSQSYSIFMGGDNKIVRIETDANNGRKLAIWKDSYGNALVPFLTSSFEEIYVLDIRYFKLNAIEFMKEHEITDVLFTMCTFTAVDVAKAKFIEENRLK